MNKTSKIFLSLVASLAGLALGSTAFAASCVDQGCHAKIVSYKFLHGPLAAEGMSVGKGCVYCHIPSGAACTASKGGDFKLVESKDTLCTLCHEASESPQHVGKRKDCLACHSPHGSDTTQTLMRAKK